MDNQKGKIYDILYPKQKECLDFFNKNNDSALFFLKTGVGKTKCSLAWLENKINTQKEISKAFIICPACKTLDWFLETQEWQTKNVFSEFKLIKLDSGKTNFEKMKTTEKTIFIISHQMFRKFNDAKRQKEFRNIWKDCCIIFDEASALKNVTSSTSKTMWTISKLLNHKNCAYLTATPQSNHKFDIFLLLKLVGFDFGYGDNLYMESENFKKYFLEYEVKEIYNPKKHEKYEIRIEKGIQKDKVEELNKLIHLRAFTLTLEDIKKAVPKNNQVIKYFENEDYYSKRKHLRKMMIEAIRNEYDAAKEIKTIKELEPLNFVTPTNCLMYERQLCSGFISNNKIEKFVTLKYKTPKLEQIKALLENTNDNVIVYYNFQQECDDILEMIKKELPDKKILIVNGHHKFEKIKNEIDNIKTQTEDYVLIGQIQACGIGINLQHFSHMIIYYSLPLSSEMKIQADGRIDRVGQNSPIYYYYLITKNSVEEKIFQTLKEHKNYTDKMFEEEIKKEE